MSLKVEHLIGIFAIILGISIFFLTNSFPDFNIGNAGVPGPAFFPNLIGGLLILVGIGEFFEARKSKRHLNFAIKNKQSLFNILVVIALILAYIFLLKKIGFILMSFFFCFVVMKLLQVSWSKSIIFALILVVILYLVFGKLFRLPLPVGIFLF